MRWASCLIAVALGAALVAGSTLGAAQQPGKMSRIGILSPAHLVDVAVFCDSDDTHTASISYFAYIGLERR